MLLKIGLITALFLLHFKSNAALKADLQSLARSQQWLRLYQYEEVSLGQFKSAIESKIYFFSPDGRDNPLKELESAIKAFSSEEGLYGGLQKTPSCAFPARKLVLESLLKQKFPKRLCPDLEDWMKRLDVSSVSLIFAGTYVQNPASLLGHTILRFYNSKSDPGLGGDPLRSYAMGFLARTDPSDSRAAYVIKGMTGGYPGFYQFEPFYMKLGLYNNSESRDLWERKLNLTKEQVQLLMLHVWEVIHSAQIGYYFTGRNCSYRLLSLIEAVRPDLNLTETLKWIVLPYDTVREVEEVGLLDEKSQFYPSIGRRLSLRLDKMTTSERTQFRKGRKDQNTVVKIESPLVLDALIDHWTLKNYKQNTNLNEKDKQQMETVFLRRAEVLEKSPQLPSSSEIAETQDLHPPEKGHSSSWWSGALGLDQDGHVLSFLEYKQGAHAYWQSSKGYDPYGSVEFLGFNFLYNHHNKSFQDWSLRLAEVASLEPFDLNFKKLSWAMSGGAEKACSLCLDQNASLYFKASGGLSFKILNSKSFLSFMLLSEARAWRFEDLDGAILPGIRSFLRLEVQQFRFISEVSYLTLRSRQDLNLKLGFYADLKPNQTIFLSHSSDFNLEGEQEDLTQLGYSQSF